MKQILILTAVALTFAGCSSAKKKADTNHSNEASAQTVTSSHSMMSEMMEPQKVSCTREKDTRILNVMKKGPGCTLDYQKFGQTKTVASSMHGLKHCLHSQKKIRTKLEKNGFKCA